LAKRRFVIVRRFQTGKRITGRADDAPDIGKIAKCVRHRRYLPATFCKIKY
jgi:hypothetical protein